MNLIIHLFIYATSEVTGRNYTRAIMRIEHTFLAATQHEVLHSALKRQTKKNLRVTSSPSNPATVVPIVRVYALQPDVGRKNIPT